MGAFASELKITHLSGKDLYGRRRWRLGEPLIYEVGGPGSGRVIRVPNDFVTDGPSIPRILRRILPVWAIYSPAGVIHDYLCYLIARNNPHPEAPTRDDADRIFFDAMTALNVGRVEKYVLYWGARLGTLLKLRTTMIDYNAALNATQIVWR